MIKIRKFRIGDTKKTTNLISSVFGKFNSREGSKEAVQKYINFYDPKKSNIERIKNNFIKSPIFFIAVNEGKIVGAIRGAGDRIINLFVDGEYHKQGIGKKLVEKFEKEAKNCGSKRIKIRASLFAVKFYEKIGYKKTTGIRLFGGLKIQPMMRYLLD